MVAPIALTPRLKVAVRSRSGRLTVTHVVEVPTAGAPLARGPEGAADLVESYLNSPALVAQQDTVVLVQLLSDELAANLVDPLEVVRQVKSHSRCWAAILVHQGWIYGADGDHETYAWPQPGGGTANTDWSAFFHKTVEYYLSTLDLAAAVRHALGPPGHHG